MAVGLLLVGCGGPPAQVAGTYSGQTQILVANNAGENQNLSEFVTVTQSGGELSFNVGSCPVKAYSDSSNSFYVDPFKCTRALRTQTWTLDVTEGSITANSQSFNMQAKGRATSGTINEVLTFSFSGTKSQ